MGAGGILIGNFLNTDWTKCTFTFFTIPLFYIDNFATAGAFGRFRFIIF